jgi:hypothetical protein
MQITKTDYLEYTACRKNLWLAKHKPELFEGVELSDFERKIIEEGNLADEAARNLFPGGRLVDINGSLAVEPTKKLLFEGPETIFQGAFKYGDFFAQADILRFNKDLQGWELFEVKASTDVKRETPNHHIRDLAFQKIVLESAGMVIVKTGVIHMNGDYVQVGETVDYNALFVMADVTEEVNSKLETVRGQMQELKEYLSMEEEKGCDCIYRGRSRHCATFSYSNPQVPEYSVHDLERIGNSKKLLEDWIDRGIVSIGDIDNPKKLKGGKLRQYNAYVSGKVLIDREGIQELFGSLQYPLYFFDFETYSSAIPRFTSWKSYSQIPFQYSLHVLHEDGSIEHKEFLITVPSHNLTAELAARMGEDMKEDGTMVSWNVSFEKQRNLDLAERHPRYAKKLQDLNDNSMDLMHVFSKGLYVDSAFKGSASIKHVLPVIVPELTYKALGIQKGDQALERWERLIFSDLAEEEKRVIVRDLLEYCKLDTFAMVKIFEYLRGL